MTLLEIEAVEKSFAGIQALDQVDFRVEPGTRVGLIGPNGAGKTTLFDAVLGMIGIDGGAIRFAGTDIRKLPTHARARLGIGRTFQRVGLFAEMSVRDHLLVADRAHHGQGALWRDIVGKGRVRADEIDRCESVLSHLGLLERGDDPIEALTLGQARLVEVGRALVTEPALLLLDEPSSGLDGHETEALTQTLLDVQATHRCSVVLVEHDVDLVRRFTETCTVLDFGRVIASGTTADVLADPKVTEAYLGRPRGDVP